jgi:hypothetical protein
MSGNEPVTTATDYFDARVDDPGATVVIAFLEQLRQPGAFVVAAQPPPHAARRSSS